MTQAQESAAAGLPLAGALAGGVGTISYDQQVIFQQYKRIILPADGFVFWIKTASLPPPTPAGPSAEYNGAGYNQVAYNQSINPVPSSTPSAITAKGSLHSTSTATQSEADSNTTETNVFTSETSVDFLNDIAPGLMYVATGTDGRRYAFSSSRSYYFQSGLHHYIGEAVRSTLQSQLIDDPLQLQVSRVVVSNSLPIWLALGTNQLGITLFPSFVVPQNQPPPYVAVHIPDDSPEILQALPLLDSQSNHYQLVKDKVRFTTYGLRNDQALDLQDYILAQPQDDACPWGLMNMPAWRDSRSVRQPEYQVLGQCKVFEMEVSYYQSRVRDIAQQLILSAIMSLTVSETPT